MIQLRTFAHHPLGRQHVPCDLLQKQIHDFAAGCNQLRRPHVAVRGQLAQLVHVRQELAQLQGLPAKYEEDGIIK